MAISGLAPAEKFDYENSIYHQSWQEYFEDYIPELIDKPKKLEDFQQDRKN